MEVDLKTLADRYFRRKAAYRALKQDMEPLALHPRIQRRLAERYIEVWLTTADAEPDPNRKDQAGRRAASFILNQGDYS